MQLTMKKTTRTFKTLEGQLLVKQGSQRTTISTRCAELDAQMPQYLGVSKAILDYVVFCHQDESLWPLSEPAALKKRFDEIFEALKFTKALDSIKVLRKERTIEIKLLTNDVGHLKTDKDRADKLRSRIQTFQKDIEVYTEQARAISETMDKITSEIASLFKSNQGFQKVLSELSEKRNSLSSLNDQIRRLQQTIEPMDDSTEDLQDRLASFESHVQKQQDDLKSLKQQIAAIRADADLIRLKHSDALGVEGRFKAAADGHRMRLAEREELVKSISRTSNIAGFTMLHLDDAQVSDFYNKLKDLALKFAANTARIKKEGEAEAEKTRVKLENARSEKNSAEMQISLNDKMAKTRAEDKARLQTQIDAISTDESEVLYAKSAVENARKNLEAAKAAVEEKEFPSIIAAKTNELREIEGKLEDVNNELLLANKQSDMRAKLRLLTEDIEKRQRSISTIKNANKDRFFKLTGSDIEENTVEMRLKTTIELAQREILEKSEAQAQTADELSRAETEYKIVKQELKSKTDKIDEDIAKFEQVFETTDISTYEEELDDLQQNLDEKKRYVDILNISHSYSF